MRWCFLGISSPLLEGQKAVSTTNNPDFNTVRRQQIKQAQMILYFDVIAFSKLILLSEEQSALSSVTEVDSSTLTLIHIRIKIPRARKRRGRRIKLNHKYNALDSYAYIKLTEVSRYPYQCYRINSTFTAVIMEYQWLSPRQHY